MKVTSGLTSSTPEWADDVERCLVPLLDPKELALMHPQIAAHHVAVVREVERLPWLEEPEVAADIACETLRDAVDPGDEAGDVPWVSAIRLAPVKTGRRIVLYWFAVHGGARYKERLFSCSVDAVASYAVGVFEWLHGREREAHLWYVYASYRCEGSLALVTYVRAANPNLVAQQGLFVRVDRPPTDLLAGLTVTTVPSGEPLGALGRRGVANHLAQVLLPHEHAARLLRTLRDQGVHGASLFPGHLGVLQLVREVFCSPEVGASASS